MAQLHEYSNPVLVETSASHYEVVEGAKRWPCQLRTMICLRPNFDLPKLYIKNSKKYFTYTEKTTLTFDFSYL